MRSLLKRLLLRKTRLRVVFYLKKRNSFFPKLADIITIQKYSAYEFENIEEYIIGKQKENIILAQQRKKLHYCAPFFDDISTQKPNFVELNGPLSYAAIFDSAKVVGGSNIVRLDNNKALYDIKYYDKCRNILYGDQGMHYYDERFCLIPIRKSNITFDHAIFLGGNFSWNYYHFLYEVLGKIDQIESMNIEITIPFLVDKKCTTIPQFVELLNFLNVKKRKIITIEKGYSYHVSKLYYFSCSNIIPPDFINVKEMQAEDILFDLQTLEYLRSSLVPHSTKKEFPKRIYISRKKASGRRKFNEDDVFSVLSEYNFETVFPEDYSLADQIALFNNADYIAGGSGAAFTNLLFCSSKSKVVIFMKKPLRFSGFSTVAKFSGADLTYMTEEMNLISDIKNMHEEFVIDPMRLKAFLSKWITE